MVNCLICLTPVSRSKPALACNVCANEVHSTCLSKTVDILAAVNTIPGVTWKCENCRLNSLTVNETNLHKLIDAKMSDSFGMLRKEIASLQQELKIESNIPAVHTTTNPPSYSSVLKKRTEPVVVIKPKNPNQSADETREHLLKYINPIEADIRLERVREVNDGGLLLGGKSDEDNQKLLSLANEKLSEDYTVKEIEGIHPRIRVVGMSANFSKDEVANYLRKCNSLIFSNTAQLEVLKVFPLKNNASKYQAVIQLNRMAYIKSVKVGHLLVGLDACKVYDAVEAYRCFKCNEYHHSAKNCKKEASCPVCSDSHDLKQCKASVKKCSNCIKFNTKSNLNNPIDHAVWEKNKCAVFKNACMKLRKDYCDDM